MYDEYQAMTIVSNYLKDIKERFMKQLLDLHKTDEEIDEIMQRLGWAIRQSKDEKSIKEMSEEE